MGEVQGQVMVADLNADGAVEIFAGAAGVRLIVRQQKVLLVVFVPAIFETCEGSPCIHKYSAHVCSQITAFFCS
jgi:hypothetical protein